MIEAATIIKRVAQWLSSELADVPTAPRVIVRTLRCSATIASRAEVRAALVAEEPTP